MLHKYYYLICLALLYICITGLNACSDDGPNWGAAGTEGICTDWGVSSATISSLMGDYTATAEESNFHCYVGVNNASFVSYKFANDKLVATLGIYKGNYTVETLASRFADYEYVGERSGAHVYVNRAKNIVVQIMKKTYKQEESITVGYAPLETVE